MIQDFLDSRQMKVTRFSALRTGRLYPQRVSRLQGHSAAGRTKSTNNSSDPFGIDLATFRLVAQCLNNLRYRVPL